MPHIARREGGAARQGDAADHGVADIDILPGAFAARGQVAGGL
jgi:hypothetical protein